MGRLKNTEQDFWSNVNIKSEDECWEWLLCKDKNGYGYFKWDNKTYKAHRVAWTLAYNEIPDDMQVLHDPVICRNKSCVNPNHLRLGTHTDNMRDSDRTKLTVEQVEYIKNNYTRVSYGRSNVLELANMFHVTRAHIIQIINENHWT